MKSIHEPIDVDVRTGGRVPRRFRWGRRSYRVCRLIDYWILQTRWWGREERRIYFRLETDRGIVEVYQTSSSDRAADLHPPESHRSESQPSESHPPESPPPELHSRRLRLERLPHRPSMFPIEGDTHTREQRLTEAAYRPDARREQETRLGRSRRDAASRLPERWVLSKIVD